MKRFVQFALMVLALSLPLVADNVVDRIVATVNGRPILQSDLDDELRFEALQAGKPLDSSTENRKQVLGHLIERELLLQQVADNYVPAPQKIDDHIAAIRALFREAKSDQDWSKVLSRYDISADELRDMSTTELEVMYFTDTRLRPIVRVDSEEVEEYYREQLVPGVKALGGKVDAIDDVRDQIEELLMQQKINVVFSAWMANLRNQANIKVLDSSLTTPIPDHGKANGAAQ